MDSASTTTYPPASVTRFYGTVDYAICTLQDRSIAFVHNKLLNDPFDPYFFIERGFSRREFIAWVRQHHPAKVRWIRKNVTVEGFSAGFKRVSEHFDERRENTYLFCTSGKNDDLLPRDNLYLWGHYGGGHRGLAIEFQSANLTRDVLKHTDPSGQITGNPWVKVNYKTQLSPLTEKAYFDFVVDGLSSNIHQANQGKKGIEQFLDQILKTKHTVWQMENEWRLLWSNGSGESTYSCPISQDSIVGVYLGLRMTDVAKNNVLAAVENAVRGVPVFQSRKSPDKLAL